MRAHVRLNLRAGAGSDVVRRLPGTKFDFRTFHQELLAEGALPLNLAEERIKRWVALQTGAVLPKLKHSVSLLRM